MSVQLRWAIQGLYAWNGQPVPALTLFFVFTPMPLRGSDGELWVGPINSPQIIKPINIYLTMKRNAIISIAAALLCAFVAAPPVAAESSEVIRLDARAARYDYRPGEVIVKFKDASRAKVQKRKSGAAASTGVGNVDDVFKLLGVSEAEELMPLTGSESFPRKMRSYSGRTVEAPALDKAYLLRISDSHRVDEAVDMLRSLDDVEFAEPNYLAYALGEEAEDINDPYYSLQYGLQDINLYRLWGMPVISKEGPVIAIIDTGVDIMHPDLKANIWENPAEAKGATGYDDDRNGYTDDVHGYDFVNQTGVLADYNGHGTHCAGIAAATGYNGLGIIGANPGARIMPLTVLQSNGSGDIATIIKAIDYAAANGAQILSMSLGTYSTSQAFEQALGRAYQKCVIVAAAGNDGYCLNHAHPENGQQMPMPMFPAAYTFVLGVQASAQGGDLAAFSNFDDDGPVYSSYGEEQLYNYELTAPGAGIMSTYPNGQYKRLNGTSMATPLVAGALSRLLQAKEYGNREELFGDLIYSSKKGILDIYAAYMIKDEDRKPELQVVSTRMVDADGDGRADAGEILEFYPTIRNGWGSARDIKLTLDCAEPANTFCEFLDTEADFGSNLSSYAMAESGAPLRIRINDNVVDGRVCRLKLRASCAEASVEQEFEIKVENGVELGGVIKEDMTLKAGVHYIVTTQLGVPDGVTLTIEPGAVIKFKKYTGISVATFGSVVAVGEPGNMITFTMADQERGYLSMLDFGAESRLEYCIFKGLVCNSDMRMYGTDCILDGMSCNMNAKHLNRSNFVNLVSSGMSNYSQLLMHCNIINNINYSESFSTILQRASSALQGNYLASCNVFNNIYCGRDYAFSYYMTSPSVYTPVLPNYLGTGKREIAQTRVFDIKYPASESFGEYDLTNMLTRPNPDAHGIVWKVLVDGVDAQDEFEQLSPLGIGRHKFEVYYNRVIDESETPMLAMGVRPPYTQTAIASEGSWRTESLPYNQFGGGRGQTNVRNGNFDKWNDWWSSEGCEITYTTGGFKYFEGNCCLSRSHKSGVTNKIYQVVEAAHNGRYKLQISAAVDNLKENNDCQYVYLNDTKLYLDEAALQGAVYEVIADVRDNVIEVGIAQTENVASRMYIDNVSLTLLEEYSNEREVPVSVYTAYLDITGKMSIDGLNRIYVDGGRDLEYFPIPLENKRFNVNVQAAGSLSTGFYGEAGLGRVTLNWEDLDMNFEDIMGYNMYRIDPDKEEGVMINERLIEAGTTTYTDYDVTPGQTYQYYYKVMTTGLKENDPSKIVAVTPLTSTLGDSNGSGAVDVADVLTTVNYASGMDPKPFIYEAADVNADTEIDILDVVGTINIIMGTPENSLLMAENEAVLSISDNTLYIDTPVELAGIQFDFVVDRERRIHVLEALEGFETLGSWTGEDCYRFMAFNLNGKTLASGRHALLELEGASLTDARLSDPQGKNVNVSYATISGIDVVDMDKAARSNALPGLYNLMGVKLGETAADLDRLPAGVYILNGWKVLKK